jgi:opacity protein-like surface antigen
VRALLRPVLTCTALTASALAVAQQSGPQAHTWLEDRLVIQLGAYSPKVDTIFRLNGSGGQVGTEVSAEEDLGLKERNTLPAVLARLRLSERWRLEAEYLSLERENARTLSRTINWGDNSYTIGTTVNSSFNTEIYRIALGYAIVKDARMEVGLALGVHATDFSATISATSVGSEEGEVLAPLPTVGLYGLYSLMPKLLVRGRVDVFSLKYEEYDGSLVNTTLGLDYQFWRNVGLGAAWRYIDYDLGITKSSYNGGIRYKFSGPMLYTILSF